MAFYGKNPSLLFLLVLLFSMYQIQARESKFFSKVTHYSNNKDSSVPFLEVPSTSPTLAPGTAPASDQTIAQNNYGLYGHDPTTKTTPTSSTTASAIDENEIIPEELSNESYQESTPAAYTNSNYNTNYYNNGYRNNYNNNGYRSQSNYNNNGYQSQSNYNNNGYETEQGISQSQSNYNNGYQNQRLSNYNKNGYETEQQGMSQSQSNYNNNGYQSQSLSNYNNNGYQSKSNYNNNGYETEQQGMSDTKFLENGKYYYDVKNNNGYQSQSLSNYNNNGYQSKSNYNNNGYETEQQGMSDTKFLENGRYYYDVKKNENNYVNGYESGKGSTRSDVYYGNNVNPNEFNTMEEYYKSQGEYEP